MSGEHRGTCQYGTKVRQRPRYCVQRGGRLRAEKGRLVLVAVLCLVLGPRRAEGQEPVKMTCYEGESYSRYGPSCR
jgi:hypothetical protein